MLQIAPAERRPHPQPAIGPVQPVEFDFSDMVVAADPPLGIAARRPNRMIGTHVDLGTVADRFVQARL